MMANRSLIWRVILKSVLFLFHVLSYYGKISVLRNLKDEAIGVNRISHSLPLTEIPRFSFVDFLNPTGGCILVSRYNSYGVKSHFVSIVFPVSKALRICIESRFGIY